MSTSRIKVRRKRKEESERMKKGNKDERKVGQLSQFVPFFNFIVVKFKPHSFSGDTG
jgi:hypothetical protein